MNESELNPSAPNAGPPRDAGDGAGAGVETLAASRPPPTKFAIVVGANMRLGATRRLSSEPMLHGLRQLGLACELYLADGKARIASADHDCLLFHYDDDAAIEMIRAARPGPRPPLLGCFSSDVYGWNRYLAVHDMVSFYIAPTAWHRQLLETQLTKPVQVIEECIDPIAFRTGFDGSGPTPAPLPAKTRRRALWFGYSESFSKGMSSLMPVIHRSVAAGELESFSLIVDQERFDRMFGGQFGVPTLPYGDRSFAEDALQFDYSILSHFALDLHVNSWIKSPNKAITALFAGLIPICSDTPNYGDLLRRFGLQRFIFSSASDLARLLAQLDPPADADAIKRSGILAALYAERSPRAVAKSLVDLVAALETDGPALAADLPPPAPMVAEYAPPPEMSFRQHLTGLLPSAYRAVKRKLQPELDERPNA